MPALKLFRPFATSPIIAEKRLPPNRSSRMIAKIRICQRLKPPICSLQNDLVALLVFLVAAFQLELQRLFVERVEQARGLQIVDSWEVAARPKAELRKEFRGCRIEQRASRTPTPSCGA